MQEEITLILAELGVLKVTGYSLMIALAAVLGIGLTMLVNHKKLGVSKSLDLSIAGFLGAMLGGHLIYCLTNIGTLMADYENGLALFFMPHLGGYTMYGAVIGGCIGIAIYALASKQSFLSLLDAAAPGMLATIFVGRLGEAFTNQGLGEWIENELLMRLPFGIEIVYEFDEYSEWRIPVFLYEAIAALALLVAVLVLLRKAHAPGRVGGIALTILGTTQIFLEQIRRDDYVRFGFVRFAQLAALAFILTVLVVRIVKAVKAHGLSLSLIIRAALLVSTTLVVIFVEFALEKPQKMPFLIAFLLLTAVISILWILQQHGVKPLPVILSAVIAAAGIACAVMLTMELPWENDLIMGIMAVDLVAMTLSVIIPDGERG